MSDENKFLIRRLRELAQTIKTGENKLRGDFQLAQTIAARLYLRHSNRAITLESNDFHQVVEILKLREE